MITLLLVDDDPLVRQGLRTWLERAPDITVVGETSTGAEAIALAPTLHPDLVLMDISMPTIDGMTTAASLRALVPHSAVVLLSLYDDAAMRARAYALGAATLVGKQEGVQVLLAAIHEAGRDFLMKQIEPGCTGSERQNDDVRESADGSGKAR